MTSQDEIRLKKRTVEPGDHMPEILDKHAGDMEWMNTHKEEYLKAEEEFIRRVTRALDWHPNMARSWLRRAMWYEIRKDRYGYPFKVKTVAEWAWDPKWLEDEPSETMDFEGKTIVTTSGSDS